MPYRYVIVIALLSVLPLSAGPVGFSGYYDPANWALTQSNADGYAVTASAPNSITLYGPDNYSNGWGETWWRITIPFGGLVSFNWAYGTTDDNGYDGAGWYLNGDQYLANSAGASGSIVNQPVAAGDVFGFYAYATDNCCGRGNITIRDFDAPAEIPEPGTLLLLGAGLMATALRRRLLA